MTVFVQTFKIVLKKAGGCCTRGRKHVKPSCYAKTAKKENINDMFICRKRFIIKYLIHNLQIIDRIALVEWIERKTNKDLISYSTKIFEKFLVIGKKIEMHG